MDNYGQLWTIMENLAKYLLKRYAKKALKDVNKVIIATEKLNLINEQWFLDFLDSLNALSVKH